LISYFSCCLVFFFFSFLPRSQDSPFAYAVLLGALAKKHQESEAPKARLSYIDATTFKKVEIDGILVHVSDLTTTYTNLMKQMEEKLEELTFGAALPKSISEWAKLEKPSNTEDGFSPIPDNHAKVSDALWSHTSFSM